jgi:hypothetical protein
VYNNTFGRWGGTSLSVTNGYNGSISIKNNLIVNPLGGGLIISDPADISAHGLDYNLYDTARPAITWNGASYATRRALNEVEPTQEAHGVDGDPLLNPYPTPTLRAGSPAAGAGTDLHLRCPECVRDLIGKPRGALWDLGALQFSPNVPTAPSNLRIIFSR